MTQETATAGFARIPPEGRTDPGVRKRFSGPALRSFFNVASNWKLTTKEQRALLGWPSESTYFNYKKGEGGVLSYDTLTRISLMLGMFKDLNILYPERSLADRWVKLPNSNPMFAGETPAAFMMTGGMDAMFSVRRLLDGRRGGWN